MTAAAQGPLAGRGGGPEHRRPLKWQDARGDTRRRADELVCTESEAVALEALRTATGEIDGDMERHTVRQYLIAERLADTHGIAYDREVLLCASFLHDAGLYGPASSGDVYIKDSARYARRTLEPLGWPEQRLRVCIDACEQHHALTSRWWMPNEVELVRRSDLVEVFPELVRFGIPRSWLKRELWQAVPRAGFWPATLAITREHWRRMLPGMFRPPVPERSSLRASGADDDTARAADVSGSGPQIEGPADGRHGVVSREKPQSHLSDRFRAAVERGMFDEAAALFSENAVFRSPVLFKPYEGRDQVVRVLRAAERVLGLGDEFRYVHHLEDPLDRVAMLEFTTVVEGKQVEGVDKLTFDDSGLITELKVMIRPASALQLVGAKMAEEFPKVGLQIPD